MPIIPGEPAYTDCPARYRGPEVEFWFCDDGVDPVKKNDWALLPFMALSDGAHAYAKHLARCCIYRGPGGREEKTKKEREIGIIFLLTLTGIIF